MNELIKVNYNEERPTVLGRDLYELLEVQERYSKWFDRMSEYGFEKGRDYTPYQTVHPQNHQEIADHQLTIEMAKEISMLQRNEKGKQARQYFIQLEAAWNTPEMVMSRALKLAEKQINGLQLLSNQQKQIIGELKPKADYYDKILLNKGLITITQIAKDYGMSGQAFNKTLHDFGIQFNQSGQWLLYAKYHDKGYTHSETVNIVHKDGTPDVKMNTKWTQKGRLFLYELLKNNDILPVIEQSISKSA